MFVLFFLLAVPQSLDGGYSCVGTDNYRDCRAPDGSTYIERRLGSEVVRQGTRSDTSTWTEYVSPVFDGSRTEGTDSHGGRWSSQCNPRLGTRGTDRSGHAFYIPPKPQRRAQPGEHAEGESRDNPC